MKAFGCRSISLIRYFSDAIEATKVKRKLNRNVNYCIPQLTNDRKQVYYNTIMIIVQL